MPTYEFLCQSCGATFEVISSIEEHERAKRESGTIQCTSCGGAKVEPQISEVLVQTSKKSA
jgi:putative FmdB family regulatory protein